MKTISKILVFVAAFGALTLVSCRKDDTPTKKVEEAKFEAPALAQAAAKVEFNTTDNQQQVVVSAPVDGKVKVVKNIEFTEAGYAIITKTTVEVKGDPAEEEVEVLPYTLEGDVYKVPGFGTVKVNKENKSVEIALEDSTGAVQEAITVTATDVETTTPPQEGTTEFNLCRKWTVSRIVVSVKGGKLGESGAGAKLDAPVTMANVEKQLKDAGVNVPTNLKLSDYDIVDINFTQAGTFLINFTKADPFSGSYNLNADRTFHYDLKGEGNYIFNGSADGKVDFERVDNVDYCYFHVNGKIENGSDVYTSTVELTLVEKD